MKRTLHIGLFISMLFFSPLLAGKEPDLGLINRWQQSIAPDTTAVSPLDAEKQQLAIELFSQTLRCCETGKRLATLDQKWDAFGYTFVPLREEDADAHASSIWILAEKTPHAVDEGLFAFRIGGSATKPKLLLQAPHSMGDFKTGEIVIKMFVEGSASAACWSTSPRVTVCGTGCSDLTHRSNSLFQSLTIAFAVAYPDSRIAQIHGFIPEGRETEHGRNAGIIVGSGLGNPTSLVTLVSTNLSGVEWESEVRLYGSSVFELGALKNAQKDSLLRLKYAGFIHLEFSPQNRERLVESAAFRSHLEESILSTHDAKAGVETVARK